jgi:hypothetical protein
MVVALISLWVGFAAGFVLAAILRGGSREEAHLPVVAAKRTPFEVSRMRLGERKATSRNALASVEAVE